MRSASSRSLGQIEMQNFPTIKFRNRQFPDEVIEVAWTPRSRRLHRSYPRQNRRAIQQGDQVASFVHVPDGCPIRFMLDNDSSVVENGRARKRARAGVNHLDRRRRQLA